jgi:hypothetical protein
MRRSRGTKVKWRGKDRDEEEMTHCMWNFEEMRRFLTAMNAKTSEVDSLKVGYLLKVD